MVIMKKRKGKKQFKLQKSMLNWKMHEQDVASGEETEHEVIPKEIRIIAQEVQIVRSLACNDLNTRNRQMRKLRKWLQLRSRSSFPITEESFLRIWKGLYYNMWMSDKPLVQEELAEQLGKLIECFDGDITLSVNFFGAYMQTMCNEWFGIDQWRIDKFMMLVRRMLRYMFHVLKRNKWTKEAIKLFNEHMKLSVLANQSPAIGLTMHYFDIFLEELAKVSQGDISAEQVGDFLCPFVTYLASCRDPKLVSHCRKQVLHHMLYQSSLGREYTEKFNAWKEMGFPTTSIQDLERVEDGNEEDAENGDAGDDEVAVTKPDVEKHLDPRAGDVDVIMPELPLDAKYVIEELERLLYKNNEITTKVRKSLRKQLNIFQIYQQGEFPLGVKRMPRFEAKTDKPLMKEKIKQLENVENELFGVGRNLKQLTKRKRRRLLKSINFAEVDESNFDQTIMKALPKQYLKERKRKANALMNGWVEEELGSDDGSPKKKQKQKQKTNNASATKASTNNEKVGDLHEGHTQNQKAKKDAKPKKVDEGEKLKTTTPTEKNAEEKQLNNTKASKIEVSEPLIVERMLDKPEHKTNSTEFKDAKSENVKSTNKLASTELKNAKSENVKSEWDAPLAEGEIEYFIPSRKIQLRKANADFVRNPLANTSTPANSKKTKSILATPKTSSAKRVKIALKHNTSQNPSEYIRQIKSSPNLPYDAHKKPGKGLLKPNSMPSPINPFYKKKIGLRLSNDTI